jgi:hypothetical protein
MPKTIDYSAFEYAIIGGQFWLTCCGCGAGFSVFSETLSFERNTFDHLTDSIGEHISGCLNAQAWQVADEPNELSIPDEL